MYSRPRIIPVLSIADGNLVKTVKFKNPRYLGDPLNAVKIFNGKGVDELCILDIVASKHRREPEYDLLKDIAAEAFMPLSYGGGITDIDQIKKIYRIGYEKIVINTSFYLNSKLITQASQFAGSQSVVVSLDIKNDIFGKRRCYFAESIEKTYYEPIAAAKLAEQLGAGELLITSVNNDGMMSGYDIELVKSIVDSVNIPVTACGGAKDIHDLKRVLFEGKAHAAAAGSMFVYFGREKAVLITAPSESELMKAGIYGGSI